MFLTGLFFLEIGILWGRIGTMICRSLDYYMLVLCFLATMPQRCRPTTEPLRPPFNLSYTWIDAFFIRLTWQAHPLNPNCLLKYVLHGPAGSKVTTPQHYRQLLVAGILNSDVNFTLKTIKSSTNGLCKHYRDSNTVFIGIPCQVPLVTDFEFFIYPHCDGRSSQKPFCGRQATWTPANGTSGLQVSYRLCDPVSAQLSTCQVFNSEGLRQGCHLTAPKDEIQTDVCILFSGTVDGRAVNQTFSRKPIDHIRSPPPNVSVSKQGGHLKVSWHHPNVCHKDLLNYTVHYSECDRPWAVTTRPGEDHVLVPFDKACRYEIWVQPGMHPSCKAAQVDCSALLVYNDGVSRDHSMTVACVVVPSFLSVLVVAVCYYVRRKRKTIFKNIPVPPSSLKEMMSSIHQSQQLFVPVREVVDVCTVSPAPAELDTLMWAVP